MALLLKQPCDEGILLAGRPGETCPPRIGYWVLAATILGSSMVFIDGMAVSVALPVIQTELNATIPQVQWVVGAYTLFLAALMLTGGSVGDRIGRRRAFLWGVGLFGLTSVWASLAPDIAHLIAARAAQGIAAALLVPGSLAMLSCCFDAEQRTKVFGIWATATALAAAAGPVLGGWLAEAFSWRWIFFINIPLALAILTISAARNAHSAEVIMRGRTDGLGTALGTLGLGWLAFGFIGASDRGLTHPVVVAAVVIGAAGIAGFVLAERRVLNPMMPLALWRSKSFAGANLLTLLLYGALAGALFFLPFNLIQVQGYSPMAAGAAWLPFVLICGALSPWAARLTRQYGAKLPLVAGPAVAALGFGLFAIPGRGGSYWLSFFPAFAVLGLGFAISITPLVTIVLESVDERHTGVASGVNNAVARSAALLAIAIFGLVVSTTFNNALDDHLAAVGAPAAVVSFLDAERINLAGADLPPGLGPGLAQQVRGAIDGAFVAGFRSAAILGAALALAGSLSALTLIQSGGRPEGPKTPLARRENDVHLRMHP